MLTYEEARAKVELFKKALHDEGWTLYGSDDGDFALGRNVD